MASHNNQKGKRMHQLYASELLNYLREKKPKMMDMTSSVIVHFAKSARTKFQSRKGIPIVVVDPALIELVGEDGQRFFYPMRDFRSDLQDKGGVGIAFVENETHGRSIPSAEDVKVCDLCIDMTPYARDGKAGYMLYPQSIRPSTLKPKTQELILQRAAEVGPFSLQK